MVIFGIVLTVVSAYVGLTEQQIRQITVDAQTARSIQTGAGNLAYLSNDYLQNRKKEQITLWHNELYDILSALSKLNQADPEETALINNIQGDLQRLETTFNSSVLYVDSIPKNETGIVHPLLKTYSNQLAVQNQALSFDITVLSSNLEVQATQARQASTVLVLSLVGLFGAFFVAVYLLAFKRTLASLTKLQKEIKVVGLGNLDHVIDADSNDEVGDLSRDFNQMTADLKAVTASKAELENEITERKKAEEALRNNELLLSGFFDSPGIMRGIVEVINGKDIRHVKDNIVTASYVGLTPKDLESKLSSELGEPSERIKIWIEHYMQSQETGKPFTWEYTDRQGSKETWLSPTVTYIGKSSEGNPRFTYVVTDVTGRKKAEVELDLYRKNLEKMVEQKTKELNGAARLATIGVTAGMVGHDIRNPLQAITSDVFLVRSELDSFPNNDSKQNAIDSLNEIEANIDYINKIVADLQDYARPLNPRAYESDLKAIVQDTITRQRLPKDLKVMVNIDEQAQKVMGDPDYLKRIINNLVLNAVQAMPNGGTLIVKGTCDGQSGEFVLTVEDTGVGIPDDVKDKLFTPMFTTKSKGQGFGLAVVKRMTETLGGTVTFESEHGKGTKFIVRLPSQRTKQ
jgi:signal transduction histidine kinase/HAMP domain-containing protein